MGKPVGVHDYLRGKQAEKELCEEIIETVVMSPALLGDKKGFTEAVKALPQNGLRDVDVSQLFHGLEDDGAISQSEYNGKHPMTGESFRRIVLCVNTGLRTQMQAAFFSGNPKDFLQMKNHYGAIGTLERALKPSKMEPTPKMIREKESELVKKLNGLLKQGMDISPFLKMLRILVQSPEYNADPDKDKIEALILLADPNLRFDLLTEEQKRIVTHIVRKLFNTIQDTNRKEGDPLLPKLEDVTTLAEVAEKCGSSGQALLKEMSQRIGLYSRVVQGGPPEVKKLHDDLLASLNERIRK